VLARLHSIGERVLVAAVDMQGRLMGKRFHAQFFVDGGHAETHCCNYLLATDMEMTTVQGYAATGWAAGSGWARPSARFPSSISPTAFPTTARARTS